ncbi:unnamed protein product [Rotaria sp. Silwood2]|nr:unnamed protein product [Rotaria sp. Silwood2]
MLGSIFHLKSISRDEDQVWKIEMSLCGDNEHKLKEVLADMKKQNGTGETNLWTLGKLLWTMGKLDLAEYYYNLFLQELPSNDPSLRKNIPDFLQISSNDLKLHEQIGHGAFGTVYRATWVIAQHVVAVKSLYLTRMNDVATKEFFKELSFMDRLRSPHIVNFYGACVETEKCALVMEYMSLGSLYKMLHEDKLVLIWPHRLSIALQAAKGINYLHQLQSPILHRDVKSGNFLLERAHEGYTVKVCDFGLARTRSETTRQTKYNPTLACTLQWTAPEILRMGRHTDKSAIYSLGIIF